MKEKEIREALDAREGIGTLNSMQEEMLRRSSEKRDIILLSPTGSGKTVAFLLPLLKWLRPTTGRVQAVIVAPSRELVLQIARVTANIAVGYRVVSLYGGHKVEDEVNSLSVIPDIIVATPGRLLDHAVRNNIDLTPVRILVLDEFDKSLELGFDDEMSRIMKRLKNVSRIILTSATDADVLPDFLNLNDPVKINYLSGNKKLHQRMSVKSVRSGENDKLISLYDLLTDINRGEVPDRSIIFVNHRESAERVHDYLRKRGVDSVLYHGALEQRDRESAIALFNSGARPILVATDLAARGLDIRNVKNVVHYHQALSPEAYTHRNGRTARVDERGDVYILLGPDEELKEYVGDNDSYRISANTEANMRSGLEVLYISAGKREKLSKGDILGFLTKQAGLPGSEIGKIEVFDHYSLVTLPADAARELESVSNSFKIKGEKRKVTLLK
ncbi:MAG: DEAD/DEAH box helicase [Muribaculaceae bacterium]|nr:DEAD/DEAH box helicase [Muribaculaceae bacterium]